MTSLTLDLAWWAVALVVVAWLPPPRWQPAAMAAVGAVFLAQRDLRSFVVLLALSVATRAVAGPGARLAMAIVIVAATMVALRLGVRIEGQAGWPVVLGLAFYGLRLIHVAVDRAAGRLDLSWRDHFAYFLFLPTLIAGPIHRAQDFLRDGALRRFDPGTFAEGMERMLYGIVKVVVLANWAGAHIGAEGRALVQHSEFLSSYLGCAQFGWNLYFQFAGYSDMAIGLARLVGYHVPENFDWPFFARNVGDFWTRWHTTVSAWCRDYVFVPLTMRVRNPYLGVGGSLLVLGLWHEVSARYCLWGLYHGLGVMGWRWLQRRKPATPPRLRLVGTAAGILATLHFVVCGFALTSEPSLSEGVRKFVRVATLGIVDV